MKFILYTWGGYTDDILKNSLIELGHTIAVFDKKCEHYTKDLNLAQELISLIHASNAEAVISSDYFPIISMVCNTVGIPYYSWVYDSPHYTLFAATSKYPCNRLGCFDNALVKRLNGLGIDTVMHLPLGVEWGEIPDSPKYACDISFVGSLYTGEYNYYDELSFDNNIKDRADVLVEKQCFDYKNDWLSGFFEDDGKSLRERIKSILVREKLLPGDEYIEDIEYIFSAHFLEKKVTVEERKRLLKAIAEKNYDFSLYTGSSLKGYPELVRFNKGYVNYHSEMPMIFKNSRINLNITLRSIKTGIPLRALDIMGCGGFLLSNYQEELKEYFREDEEMVMFYSLEDCLEKIDFYLKHEDERRRIANGGYAAVKERFDYGNQLEKLINM